VRRVEKQKQRGPGLLRPKQSNIYGIGVACLLRRIYIFVVGGCASPRRKCNGGAAPRVCVCVCVCVVRASVFIASILQTVGINV